MICQGALKGTNLIKGTKASPKRKFSQMFADFADSRLFLENKAFGKRKIFAENRRFSQETTDFCRNPQRKLQIGVCPLRFVPLSAAPNLGYNGLEA